MGDSMERIHIKNHEKKSTIGDIINIFSSKKSNYAYSVTRIRAMKAKLIKKDEFSRYLNLETDDIIRNIEELDYKNDIDELSRKYKDITLIEHSLNRNMANSFQKILSITKGELHDLIQSYLKKYDIWNIKTILRGINNNINKNQILETLITAGSLRYTFLSKLLTLNNEEIINWIKKTEYGKLICFENENINLQKTENKLDKYYYNKLFEEIGNPLTSDKKYFIDFIKRTIDIININTLIRIKKEGIPTIKNNLFNEENIFDLMIENGKEININKIKKMISLSNEEFYNELKHTSYWKSIQLYINNNKNINIKNIENSLLKYNLKNTTKKSHQSIISIIPILEYLIYKNNETRNLRIILRGKSSNLNNDIIKQEMVII